MRLNTMEITRWLHNPVLVPCAIFQGTSPAKNCECYCETLIDKIFHGLRSYRNDVKISVKNFAVKPLACVSWFHLVPLEF